MAWLHSYPKIFALGHRAVRDLLVHDVIAEEKVDGSQISFGVDDVRGELHVRSKGAELNILAPDKMFAPGVASIQARKDLLKPGWTYRGEYLAKPKHNTLAYERTPKDHIVVFDVNPGLEAYLSADEKKAEAERIGYEPVPNLFRGKINDPEEIRRMLQRTSFLGAVPIEGVVIKPAGGDLFGIDGKLLIAKFVSEAFKEVHGGEWREKNPTNNDILAILGGRYRTPARWMKAVGHLRDAGRLEGSPRDIGLLVREVPGDILAECGDDIKDELLRWAWSHIQRQVIAGLAEWYKDQLLQAQFQKDVPAVSATVVPE